jgi:hypothetical protein
MAATTNAESLTARSLRRLCDFDPNSGSAIVATLNPAASEAGIAIANYRRFLFGIFRSVGTGAISAVTVTAGANAALTTTATTVTSTTVSATTVTTADAVGDTLWFEVTAEQIREVLATATHVGLTITLATSTDECVIYVQASESFYPVAGLTADYIS